MFEGLVRENIRNLQPYSSARDEFFGTAEIHLDANENPFKYPYHRYPDPYQRELKREIAKLKQLNPGNLFLGNGSDEIIDLLIRAFVEPYRESILTCLPSYGMYKVSAAVNGVQLREFLLNESFSFSAQELIQDIQKTDKIIFLCSPNNPTGNSIELETIRHIAKQFHGLIVVDEAYIDFSDNPSASLLISDCPNIVVLQTFSKAFAAAGLRLGIGIMHVEIVTILNKIKPPYNVNQATQTLAIQQLSKYDELQRSIQSIQEEKTRLSETLQHFPFVKRIFPSDANFILVRLDDADKVYNYLKQNGIIVRNRSRLHNCENCLRITIGTFAENNKLLNVLTSYT